MRGYRAQKEPFDRRLGTRLQRKISSRTIAALEQLMNVAVVKYNSGNVRSVKNALERLGVEPFLTDSPDELKNADKVIFPGVGEAASAMRYLREKGLDAAIRSLTQPVLAVCLGMQLLCRFSEENQT